MPEPIAGILGLCRRAGRLVAGYDAAADAMRRGQAALLLLAADVSARTERSARELAGQTQTETGRLPLTMDEVGFAISKRAGVLAVCDSGFAKKCKELLDKGPHTAQVEEELHR